MVGKLLSGLVGKASLVTLTMVVCVFVNKTNDDSVGGDGLPHQRI